MATQTPYEYYTAQGKALPPPSQRFNDTDWASAAAKAGITKDAYLAAGANNASLNNAIMAQLQNAPTNPSVQPSAGGTGSLDGTMTKPPATTPPPPPAATGTPPVQGQAPAGQPGGYQNMPLDLFGNAMNEIRSKLSKNEDLTKQKALLLKQVYDTHLTPDEMKNLTPAQRTAIMGQNTKLIDMELRLINDELKGRTSTLDTSIKYITDIYREEKKSREAAFADAQNVVYQFVQQYGSQAGEALKSLYGPDKMNELRDMGIDIDSFAGIKTLDEIKNAEAARIAGVKAGGGSGLSPTSIEDLSPRAKAVYDNPAILANYTPTEKGKILSELASAGANLDRFALNALTASQRDQIALFDEIEADAQTIGNLSPKVNTGPIASRTGSLASIVGLASPEFVELRGAIANMSSILLRMRSGAAVTPQEYERIRGFIPELNDDEKTVQMKISKFYAEISAAKTNYIKRSTQSTYDIVTDEQRGFGGNAADPLGLGL